MGANIPGKKQEQLNYLNSIKEYARECHKALDSLEGFTVLHHSDKQSNGMGGEVEIH